MAPQSAAAASTARASSVATTTTTTTAAPAIVIVPRAVPAPAAATAATATPAATEDSGGPVLTRSGLTPAEERRLNGQYMAVSLVLVVAVMGLCHAFRQQSAVLAGFLVPALIMLLYLLWVLYSASRARAKRLQLMRIIAASAAPASKHHATHQVPHVVVQGPTPVRDLPSEKIV